MLKEKKEKRERREKARMMVSRCVVVSSFSHFRVVTITEM